MTIRFFYFLEITCSKLTKDSDKGPAMGVRMTQVAKRTSQCGEWITPTIRDQQAGGALAFLTQRDVLPAQRSCTPGQDPSQRASDERGSEDRTRAWTERWHSAFIGSKHGDHNVSTFPCPSIRRNMNLTMAFSVHSAEMSIKVRLW